MFNFLRSLDRRRHARITVPTLVLRINGSRYESVDWSLGGFRITGYRKKAEKGAQVIGKIEYAGSARGEFVAEIAVVYDASTGDIGARFLEITPSVMIAMSGLGEL